MLNEKQDISMGIFKISLSEDGKLLRNDCISHHIIKILLLTENIICKMVIVKISPIITKKNILFINIACLSPISKMILRVQIE